MQQRHISIASIFYVKNWLDGTREDPEPTIRDHVYGGNSIVDEHPPQLDNAEWKAKKKKDFLTLLEYLRI